MPDPISTGQRARRQFLTRAAQAAVASTLGLLAVHAAAQTPAAVKPPAGAHLKIVFHVSDADGWMPAFSNLKNMTAMHPNAKLRVIVDGSGVYMFQGRTDMTPLFEKYAAAGVEFQACHNALDEKQVPIASLPKFVQVVPAAVVAIAESQYAGYAYVKP